MRAASISIWREDASLLLCEIVVFGRAAMGETMQHGEFVDRWRLRRGGKLVFAETVRLDGDIGEKLARPAVANGGVAIGTALIVPGDEALVAADARRLEIVRRRGRHLRLEWHLQWRASVPEMRRGCAPT